MRRQPWHRSAACALLMVIVCTSVGCSRELREGLLAGLAAYVTDVTYGVLAEWLPFPLGDAPGGSNGGDPFSDPPIQL